MMTWRRTQGPDRRAARRSLAGLISRGIVGGGDLDELSTLLRRAFAAEALAMGQGSTRFEPTTRIDEVPRAWIEAHQSLAHLDPSTGWLERAPEASIFRIGAFIEAKTAAPELAQTFLDHDWSDGAMSLLPHPFGSPIFFVLYRRTGRFSADEVTELSLLGPALATALATRSALSALQAPANEPAEQAFARAITHATVDLPSGKCTWAQDAAARLEPHAGRLSASDLARFEPVLRALVAGRRTSARSRRFAFGLRAELAWLPPPPGVAQRALVLLVDDPLPAVDPRSPLLEALSPRQRSVALAAAGGAPLARVARSLGISVETARTHLYASYRVLGVENRAELAALLAP
jgi:DNA-binding CsgD family transcriptional regulator